MKPIKIILPVFFGLFCMQVFAAEVTVKAVEGSSVLRQRDLQVEVCTRASKETTTIFKTTSNDGTFTVNSDEYSDIGCTSVVKSDLASLNFHAPVTPGKEITIEFSPMGNCWTGPCPETGKKK